METPDLLRDALATFDELFAQADFITTINVLRRMVANLGGNGNLPDDGK